MIVETNDRDKEQFQKYQQRVAEKYWKERQINEKKRSKKNIFLSYEIIASPL